MDFDDFIEFFIHAHLKIIYQSTHEKLKNVPKLELQNENCNKKKIL